MTFNAAYDQVILVSETKLSWLGATYTDSDVTVSGNASGQDELEVAVSFSF